MKLKSPTAEYLEKAKALSREDAERLLARMRGKLMRRVGDDKLNPLEAVAMQLALEDEHLEEWRRRLAELRKKEEKS